MAYSIRVKFQVNPRSLLFVNFISWDTASRSNFMSSEKFAFWSSLGLGLFVYYRRFLVSPTSNAIVIFGDLRCTTLEDSTFDWVDLDLGRIVVGSFLKLLGGPHDC